MRGILNKILLIILDGLTKEYCIAAFLFSKSTLALVRGSGLLFTALYLKQCSSSLQMAYGGDKFTHELLPVPVSLTRSGYPRIIPSFHRRFLYRKDEKADMLVKIFLSFFSLYRIVELAKKVDKSTFKSIISPWDDPDRVETTVSLIKEDMRDLLVRYTPWIKDIPLNQGMSFDPSWKALPTYPQMAEGFSSFLRGEGKRGWPIKWRSPFLAFLYELSAYSMLLETIHKLGEQWSSGILWRTRVRYAWDVNNKLFSGSDLDYFERFNGPLLPSYRQLGIPPVTGRLGQTLEGGAKRRIFAIGNFINQRLLKPFHDWLMAVLSHLPTDGTFNQTAPLDRLVGKMTVSSFDLKLATDRWPLLVLQEITRYLFDDGFASGAVETALASTRGPFY